MLPPDLQRIEHIRDYCIAIKDIPILQQFCDEQLAGLDE